MKILAGMPWRLDWKHTGLSRRTLQFFRELALRETEVELLCAGPDRREKGFHSRTLELPRIEEGSLWASLLNSLAFSSRFAERVKKSRYDALHCFNTTSLFLSQEPYLLQTLNPTYAFSYDLMREEYPKEPEYERILTYYSTIAELERKEYQRASLIVTRSHAVKDNITKFHGVTPDNIHVVPDGVTPPETRRHTKPREEGEMRIILFSGSIRLMKGFLYLIEAMERVVEEVPETILVAAGSIHPPDRALIEKKIEESPVGKRIITTGFMPGDRYTRYLNSTTVGCVPSIGQASLAILEYVAHRIPVVTTKFSGLQMIDSVGIEVPPRESKQLAEALIRALTYPDIRERIKKGAPDILRIHNWSRIAETFRGLYTAAASHYSGT